MTSDLRREVSEFARLRVAPRAAEGDRLERYDHDLHAELAAAGWLGLSIPSEFGGAGLAPSTTYAVIEELATADITAAAIVSGQVTLVADLLAREASADLAGRWVPGIVAGEKIGCYALTEPDAGSNPAEMSTTAAAADGGVALTGQKIWITNGGIADAAVVYAREGDGISAFLVEMSSPGVTVAPMHGKLGFRASDTAEFAMDGVFVPEADRIGAPGGGLAVALSTLDNGRLGIAAMAVGAMRGIGERLAKAVAERPDQAGMRQVADLELAVSSAAALLRRALDLKESGERFTREAAMAKWRASGGATAAANALISRVGAGGTAGSWAERVWRDVRVMELFEGTSEIQKLLIASGLTGVRAFG